MLDSTLLYLLILVAVAIGWTLGFRYANQARKPVQPNFIPSVDMLLAEANDESLKDMLSVEAIDDNALDAFLKLGKSFRNKGETERAIQLHQSLFARADLPSTSLQAIELELALDYASAGLLDRAESLFTRLLQYKGRVHTKASRYLLELLEEEGEWQQIVSLYQSKQLASSDVDKDNLKSRIAHAYCELAEQEAKKRNFLEIHKYCKQALKTDTKCARAYVVMGDTAYSQNEPSEAIRCYLKAADIDSHVVINMTTNLIASFRAVDDIEGLYKHLQKQWLATRYVPSLMATIETEVNRSNVDQALSKLLQELSEQPSNQGFYALLEIVVREGQSLDTHQLETVHAILSGIVNQEPKYLCRHCGFKAQETHWRCPSCKNWSTLRAYNPNANKPSSFGHL